LELHPRAEIHSLGVPAGFAAARKGSRVDDGHALEAFAQEANAPIDLVQALLSIGVFGIFRAVALRGRFRHGDGDARSFLEPELVEFVAQALRSFGSNVLGAWRRRRTVS